MNTTNHVRCFWAGREKPRALSGRHAQDCPESIWHPPLTWTDCRGCEPCHRGHCRVCGVEHVDDSLTCPACVGEVRTDLDAIFALTASLPAEAMARGPHSEAFHLDGPTANPEAWRQRGRYGHVYEYEARLGDNHPLWVLGTWDLAVTERYGHTRTAQVTVSSARSYLDRNLTDLAQQPDFAFEDLASSLRSCRSHLEAVLHDQSQGDRANVDCFDCGGQLVRKLGADGFEDQWTCRRCRRRYSYAEYNFALRAKLEAKLEEPA